MIPSVPRWQFQICMQEFGFKLHIFYTQRIEKGNELRKTKNKIPTYIFSATKRKIWLEKCVEWLSGSVLYCECCKIPLISLRFRLIPTRSKTYQNWQFGPNTVCPVTHFLQISATSFLKSLLSLSKPNHSDSPLTHSLTVWWWWDPIWGGFAVVVGWVMAWTSEDRSTDGRQQWGGKRECHTEKRATKREQKRVTEREHPFQITLLC